MSLMWQGAEVPLKTLNRCHQRARVFGSKIYPANQKRHAGDSNLKPQQTTSSSEYCLNLVRQWDFEGFLSSILIPDAVQRTTAVAVRAFNVEVALVAQRVSNPMIGQGRLQFWHHTLEQIGRGQGPQHPVALELLRAFQRNKFQKRFLHRLISCRESQLKTPGFHSFAEMEQYAEDSMSPVFYLILQSAGSASLKVDHVASHLGKALGISNALRSLARARSPGEVNLPREMLLKHSVSQESLLRGLSDAPGLKDAVFEVASSAKQHLDKARSLSADVPAALSPIMLPAIPVSRYLDLLRLADFNPFHPSLQRRSGILPLAMWWNRLRKTY